jgi:hypothetical protein
MLNVTTSLGASIAPALPRDINTRNEKIMTMVRSVLCPTRVR